MKLRFLVPLIVFFSLVGLFYVGLSLNPREIPSPLIDKPAPEFALETLHDAEQQFSRRDLLGKVSVVNVWASWCVSCRQEHPILVDANQRGEAAIIGLNYKDTRPAGINWLNQLGNPYLVSLFDESGRVGIDWGVYGVPESFVVDKQGIIRYKHIGPVTRQSWAEKIVPLLRQLEKEPG